MKAVVFDLDGTLIDSAPDIAAAANAVLAEDGLRQITLAEATRFVGGGAGIFVRRMMAALDLPEDAALHESLLARFLARYETATALSRLYPGATETLSALAAAGHPVGLCTNKPLGPTRAVLAHFQLIDRFGVVIAGDSLEARKPDPAPLAAAFAALGATSGLYVGDSEVDAETAERFGCPFLLFTEGYRQTPAHALTHRATFSDHRELPALIAGLAAEPA